MPLHACLLQGEYPPQIAIPTGSDRWEARLQTTDDRSTWADDAGDTQGRWPAPRCEGTNRFFPRDAVAPRPHPRGYVHPW